jgi:phosphatidylinositol kinase/protein kinase (PI-3  family)
MRALGLSLRCYKRSLGLLSLIKVRRPLFFSSVTASCDSVLTVLYADDQIRAQVLKGLDKDYDRHLAQVENVRLLFMVLNDDSYAVRIRAVRIIGRLANMTPGAIMPSLRKVLIQLLTELEYSTDVYVPATFGLYWNED